jgi:hypothetical protein
MNGNEPTIAKLFCRLLLLALLAVLAPQAFAITLETYKSRIVSARLMAIRFEDALRANERDHSLKLEFVQQVRRDFPESERVEWDGGAAETSNGWLLEKAKAVESETLPDKLLSNVMEFREYLSAVLYKIDELERSRSNEGRTKDEDKQKLAEILKREEYQKLQEQQESLFQRWVRAFLEWLEGLFPKSSGPAQDFSSLGVIASVLRVILYVLLFGLLAFVAYKVAQLFVPALARRRKAVKKKERVILGERLDENETAADLFGEAERLAREGDLRGAIRKGYIALLCDLSDRRVIGLARSKTNRDYLRDVRSRGELYPRMKAVTDTFERHWYGSLESAESDWSSFRDQYQEAIRSV